MKCEPCGVSWTAPVNNCPECGKPSVSGSSPEHATPTGRVVALTADINAGRYGKPLIAALYLCHELAQALEMSEARSERTLRTYDCETCGAKALYEGEPE